MGTLIYLKPENIINYVFKRYGLEWFTMNPYIIVFHNKSRRVGTAIVGQIQFWTVWGKGREEERDPHHQPAISQLVQPEPERTQPLACLS
jgi:hypothetical protein